MYEKITSLLQDPLSGEPLDWSGDGYRNPQSGVCYPLREGIACFQGEVTGQNAKYRQMYDRLAVGYDLAERLYYVFTRKPNYRLEFIAELEARPGMRILEVSVGTGANVRFLPPDKEFWGLDLSWGMLRRCARKLSRGTSPYSLFHGEAEHLPFRDGLFDCVYHIGGINFFNDKAQAIREMIRVARPGAKIVLSDETEEVVRESYQRNPATRKYFEKGTEAVAAPVDLVPGEMQEIQLQEICKGKMYCLSFRKPAES